MSILERLHNRSPRAGHDDPGRPEARSAGDHQLPIDRYDELADKQLIASFPQLSQLELATVSIHERSHQNRLAVLNKLHWLRASEPMPGYDALDTDEIVHALAAADTATLKAVRGYERHHRNRHAVRAEIARVLPSSNASAGETRAREQQTALIRQGFASRAKAGAGPPNDRPAPPAGADR